MYYSHYSLIFMYNLCKQMHTAVSGNKSPLKFFDTNLPRIHYCQQYILVPKKGLPFTFRHLKFTSVHKMTRSDVMASINNVDHNNRVFSFHLFITQVIMPKLSHSLYVPQGILVQALRVL